MNTSAIVLMIVSVTIIWGGLAVSLYLLAKRTRAEALESVGQEAGSAWSTGAASTPAADDSKTAEG